jgi:sugar lactone lactonase YvrE
MGSADATVDLLHDLHADLGEAPTWDERLQRLYFVDINKQKIYSCNADGSDLFSIDTHETVGTIALTTDQNLLLACMNRSVFPVDVSKRTVGEAIATVPEEHGVEPPPEGMRFNDGKASPGGVLLVGRMHMKFSEGAPGRLYRLHWDRRAEGHFEELRGPELTGLPNGLAWEQSRLYHADTYHKTITAYETDERGVPVRGTPGKPVEGKVVIRVPDSHGEGPDGMCISREGNLWVALPQGGAIGCYSPKTGQLVTKVELPVKCPTCCTFGGAKLDRLYVTSMKEEGEGASEHWGGLFSVSIPGEFGLAPAYKVKVPDS